MLRRAVNGARRRLNQRMNLTNADWLILSIIVMYILCKTAGAYGVDDIRICSLDTPETLVKSWDHMKSCNNWVI